MVGPMLPKGHHMAQAAPEHLVTSHCPCRKLLQSFAHFIYTVVDVDTLKKQAAANRAATTLGGMG